ncbi:MAG: phosphoglucomutase/phosphomannomutase family protein [Chloroflexi bacterium]|nr:phosphoglucomutase/phosphomannomutase family protein [Chloroflexota bacterium]
MTIRFGTDGWRAVISEDFTFANVRRVAQAIADMTLAQNSHSSPLFIVGYDTRFLSDRYAAAVASVLAGNGIRVLLSQRFAPTPAISYAIVAHQAQGGVMITASHNPPRYNGIKLKAAYGGSASNADVKIVEQHLQSNEQRHCHPQVMPLESARRQGLIDSFDPYPAYATHLRTLINFDTIAASGMHIAVDAMYGAGIHYTDRLLQEAGLEPLCLHHEMNPGFGGLHPEPIGRHLVELRRTVHDGDFELGLATDGDADRIGAVCASGAFLDPHRIMTLTLDYLLQQGKRGAVVKTVSTTQMLNRLAAAADLTVHETPVGFNYISDLMRSNHVLIGGEESGGISIQGHIPEGDGVLMSLLLTELVAAQGGNVEKLIYDIMDRIGHFAYGRHDYEVRPFSKADMVQQLVAHAPTRLADKNVQNISTRDGVKYILQDDNWLLIRPSGTEPVLRVYAEARDQAGVQALLEAGGKLAQTVQTQPAF